MLKRRKSKVPRSARGLPFWMRKLGQLWRLVRESHTEPLKGGSRLPLVIAEDEAAITFIGHSSFLIQLGGRAVLIDPVFATRLILLRRARRPGVRVRDLPQIDAVLLTHAHMDHLNRPSLRAVTREMRRRGLPAPVAIVPHGVEDLVSDLGFDHVQALRWWQSTELAGSEPLRVTMTPAKHWGARMFNDTHRGFGGYVLETRGTNSSARIYHSGDTAYFNGFREIGRRLEPDVALLPIGAYFPDSYRAVHTSPEEALQGFLDLGAAMMTPMHYNTFRLGREPMDEPLPRLLSAADKAGVGDRVHPLAEGETWLVPICVSDEQSLIARGA
ncbi:MAG TPA: MBL fold metallo-hydrolase [Acidobacteriaceae bacterium]|jgi:L-ascorbate metabolism protein UlaG (beta-lactamase superfamily)|nr:MBL fold metallo-hydrolase [Acidobacteriaceae bacterium]